ncbi:CshA/CshB family fibrillar adhesin-related protein [Marilutibacter maris]|uniref:CshA/CshB family fibrillar adhesin-related protein n=1 Tax=Marilutibacter maris TaxID=1605891 RepID=UPI0011AEBF52|nr:CshA/CshB family fibrillar adhesin-related protein [Lysobacter maris]
MGKAAATGQGQSNRMGWGRWSLPAPVYLALAVLFLMPAPVQAQYATGDFGVYRNSIVWFRWGNHLQNIPNTGVTITNSTAVDGQFLRVTCTLSSISGSGPNPDAVAYRLGAWAGDILDDLYHIGGAGPANQLVVGLANRTDGATVFGNIACSATFGPTNSVADPAYPLNGLVFADAEQSNAGQNESVGAAWPLGTWRLIERASTCGQSGSTTTRSTAHNGLTLGGASPICNIAIGDAGPAGIAFLDGSTSFNFAVDGSGPISLAWTMPGPAGLVPGASYMRLRIGAVDVRVNVPAGNAFSGEVEDHPVTLTMATDLAITKTNTPGVNGKVDQAGDAVVSGATTTDEIRVTNNGPNEVAGALVRDTAAAGLDCPPGSPVTISGDGIPAGGPFDIADLTGSGIAFGHLGVGDVAVLEFSCSVQ